MTRYPYIMPNIISIFLRKIYLAYFIFISYLWKESKQSKQL
uniref:Uncharacterized protein n=1 Tax=viral metagenome TaxID=1070528 RepID=A0A6C0DVX8_9ZZZZ